MAQFKPYTPPWNIYLAPPGTAEPGFGYTGSGTDITLDPPPAIWIALTPTPLGDEYVEFMLVKQEVDQEVPVNDVWSARSYREKMEASIKIMLPDFDGLDVAKLFGQTVTTTAAAANEHGTIKFSLDPGLDIEHFALLLRGSSDHDENGTRKLPRQWWYPLVKEANGITTTFGRKHAEFEALFMVYKHSTLGVGNWLEANVPSTG